MSDSDIAYKKVKDEAQALADATGFDYGVEQLGGRWRSFMLPQRQNRSGHELRCEVVSATNGAKQRPGHGWRKE